MQALRYRYSYGRDTWQQEGTLSEEEIKGTSILNSNSGRPTDAVRVRSKVRAQDLRHTELVVASMPDCCLQLSIGDANARLTYLTRLLDLLRSSGQTVFWSIADGKELSRVRSISVSQSTDAPAGFLALSTEQVKDVVKGDLLKRGITPFSLWGQVRDSGHSALFLTVKLFRGIDVIDRASGSPFVARDSGLSTLFLTVKLFRGIIVIDRASGSPFVARNYQFQYLTLNLLPVDHPLDLASSLGDQAGELEESEMIEMVNNALAWYNHHHRATVTMEWATLIKGEAWFLFHLSHDWAAMPAIPHQDIFGSMSSPPEFVTTFNGNNLLTSEQAKDRVVRSSISAGRQAVEGLSATFLP